jgi:hypothetical protein
MDFTTLLATATLIFTTTHRPDVGKVALKPENGKPKEAADITGYYACRGSEGPGKTYTGVAVISKKNDVYLIQWVVGVGAAFYGVGIRDGDMLSCSWALPGDKGVVRGANLYRIETGRLVGRWTALPGDGRIRTEVLTFLKKLEEE